MKATPAIYLGKIVNKQNFRAFIYGADGQKRLVESWEAFEASMQSGIWFPTRKEAESCKAPILSDESDKSVVVEEKVKPAPKAKPKAKPKSKNLDDVVFEVKDGE
jgi:hypothetical protein